MRGDLCEWDHGADPVVLEDAALTRVLAGPPALAGTRYTLTQTHSKYIGTSTNSHTRKHRHSIKVTHIYK